MRKGPGSAYDKWNMSVVICDTEYRINRYIYIYSICRLKSWVILYPVFQLAFIVHFLSLLLFLFFSYHVTSKSLKQYSQLPWHVFAQIYSEENPVVYPNFTNRTVYNTYKIKGCNDHNSPPTVYMNQSAWHMHTQYGVTQWWWLALFS